ncbi:MAG: hypothetical protein K2X66_16590 [Cyanobacteria bacterium]|nr:hypothetical protein [Cyanobacteriota bacterium]
MRNFPKILISMFGLMLVLQGFTDFEQKAHATKAPPLKAKAVSKKTLSPPNTPPKELGISVATAESIIGGYLTQIDESLSQELAIYTKEAIQKRYTDIFQGLGVESNNLSKVEQHVNVWKHWNGVCTEYYERHRSLLKQSLDLIKSQGYAKPQDMAYLKEGMARWSRYEKGMKYMLLTDLEAFGKERGYGVLSEQIREKTQERYADPFKDQIHMNYTVQHAMWDDYFGQCQKMHFSALNLPDRMPIPKETITRNALID